MQVLPLLTPSKFNSHKRSRSEDDVDSNYFKKRLLSLSPSKTTDEEEEVIVDFRGNDTTENDKLPQQTDGLNTASPLQDELGETKYCIPDLVLNEKNSNPTSLEAAQAGRLILYKPNTYLPLSPPLSPTTTTTRKGEDTYEPMEID
ncbi:hypothetical protein HPULCUR_007306 [Helicostylum pulchrum]|uniref:Uncharacterized protein n=1 Tax=Helicostylum pulchrum TaxID=562976 RepID=A0ABP9Y4G3_9FUNG